MQVRLWLSLLVVVLFASASLADEEEFTSFFAYLSTFHSYYPEYVPPIPSISLSTIFIADTDDSSAPFGFVTWSREGAIPTFDLPPASYFQTSLFGNGPGNDGFIVESSEPGNAVDNASTLCVSAVLALSMIVVALL